jgi:hypothetical protein
MEREEAPKKVEHMGGGYLSDGSSREHNSRTDPTLRSGALAGRVLLWVLERQPRSVPLGRHGDERGLQEHQERSPAASRIRISAWSRDRPGALTRVPPSVGSAPGVAVESEDNPRGWAAGAATAEESRWEEGGRGEQVGVAAGTSGGGEQGSRGGGEEGN